MIMVREGFGLQLAAHKATQHIFCGGRASMLAWLQYCPFKIALPVLIHVLAQ